MTNERSEADCPADVLEAIPWYPDGLGERQRGALEAHAAVCAECRRELAFVQGEPAEEPAAVPDPERVWARVLERVAAEGGEARLEAAPRPAPREAAPRRRLRAALGRLSLAASVALALGFGALGLAAGALLRGAEPPSYFTASAPAEGAAAGASLDVVFRSDVTAGEIEAALRAIGGSVVGGPTPRGVFQVALRPGADAAVAAAALGAEADGVASFVGPAHP
jgi:anti-sigma factor RsiW